MMKQQKKEEKKFLGATGTLTFLTFTFLQFL